MQKYMAARGCTWLHALKRRARAWASPDVAGTTGGEQNSARDGSVKAAEDDLGSSKSEMSDIDVRSRQERKSGGFFRGLRARVRSAFGDG